MARLDRPTPEPRPGIDPTESQSGIGAGIGVKVAGRTLRAGAELAFLTSDELDASLDPILKVLRALLGTRPSMLENQAQGIASAAGAVTIDCGAPTAQTTWDVKRLIVGGVADAAAVPCTVRIYRVEASNPLRLVDFGVQLPSVGFYSRHEFNLKPQEHIFVVVTGAPAAQGVFVTYSAEETVWGAREAYDL
jgi:hypothetical protein